MHRSPIGPVRPATSAPRGLDALLGGLNAEQLRAVTHGQGPLLVVAGAGTGKTQVVTRRIAWLIATRRARPSEILALTFTDKAAAEMQARVDGLVPYGYTDTAISTFHALGDRLIREFAFELGLAPDVRVLSRPEVVIFLRERLFDFDLERFRPLGDPTRFLGALATHFSRLKDEDIDAATYLAAADRESAEATLLAELVAETDPSAETRDAASAAVEAAERPDSSWPARMRVTKRCSARPASSTSAIRSPSPCAWCASRPRRDTRSGSASGTSSSTSSRTRTGPRPSSSNGSPDPAGMSPSWATTISRSTGSVARR